MPKRNKKALKLTIYAKKTADEFEQLLFRLQLNFIRVAEEAIVRELAATQELIDCLNALLRPCLLKSQQIGSEIGEWALAYFVHSLKVLLGFLTSMTDALARSVKFSQAKLALLNGSTPEEREKVLNAAHQVDESRTGCTIIRQQIARMASDLVSHFRQNLPE